MLDIPVRIINPERIPQAEEALGEVFSYLYNNSADYRRRVREDLIRRGKIKADNKV